MSTTVASSDASDPVIKALENPNYAWRTVKGIVSETGLPEDRVVDTLAKLPDVVVRATDADGRNIFTTRKHYEKTHGFGDKLLSALADRVVT